MKRKRSRRWPGLVVLGSLAVVALAAGASWGDLAPRLMVARAGRPALPPLQEHAALVVWNAHCQAWLELAVVLLQVAAVASLGLAWVPAAGRWADRGRRACIAAIVGLGVCGTCCAGYDSEFALFAGATMALLLIVAIVGDVPAGAPRPAEGNDPTAVA